MSTNDFWYKHEGEVESPPQSNHIWVWDTYEDNYGPDYNGEPWCGAAVIEACIENGWKPPGDWISVAAIENWGKANGRYHSGASGARETDVLICFGFGVHVEQAMASVSSGKLKCGGGNTSEGGQSNNGGKFCVQNRPTYDIRGYVRIDDLLDKPGSSTNEGVDEDVAVIIKTKNGAGKHYLLSGNKMAPLDAGYVVTQPGDVTIINLDDKDDGSDLKNVFK